MKRYTVPILFIISCVFILTSCGFANKDVKKIYAYLEKSANVEQNLSDMQKSLINNQKQENDIYDKILDLKLNDGSKIESLSDKANKLTERRKDILKQEKKMIDGSYKQYEKAKPILNDLQDKDDLKSKAEKVIHSASERYKTFNQLYKDYIDDIELNKNLYTLLHEKNLDQTAYKKQIDNINRKSKEITNLRNKFNDYTKAYNKAKLSLYNAGHLNVDYDDK
ncbi:YkyA family protein [Scopulibacillus cellulosilyticus]|uniref:YkyA family protein n=1 Tax=Scopulibacillus cellulosilyticus TaxID=2665665 RepID=A0ABW2PTY3_9BACL